MIGVDLKDFDEKNLSTPIILYLFFEGLYWTSEGYLNQLEWVALVGLVIALRELKVGKKNM